MQDVGGKEDTELCREDLILNWRELSVESLGRCQSAGNWLASIADRIQRAEEIYAHSEKKRPESWIPALWITNWLRGQI